MQPTDIFPRIKIVRMDDCLAHEGIVPRWVDQIATNLLDHGVLKNPIIVSQRTGRRHIVIDGMHRFAACRKLEIPDIAVYEVNYAAPTVRLEGWDALVFRPFRARRFLARHFPRAAGYRIAPVATAQLAQAALDARRALLAAGDAAGGYYLLSSGGRATIGRLVRASEVVDKALDAAGLHPVYVPDSLSLDDFRKTRAHGLIIRPHYTKAEIIERTRARKLFPRKSTRHLVPGRPLRVDVHLTLLRARIPLATKNRLLDAHLRWCYEQDRLRYYPEAVFVFAD